MGKSNGVYYYRVKACNRGGCSGYATGANGVSVEIATPMGACPVAQIPGTPPIAYLHTDALGSPVVATADGGDVLWRETYRPYGERIKRDSAAAPNTRWYTGHPQDVETGLTYMGARYYDPVIGRFMAVDPKGFDEDNLHSFNRYAYGNNNPYRYKDPNGLWAEDIVLAVPGIVVGSMSLVDNLKSGQFGSAAVDVAGLAYDVVAAALPGVMGGAGLVIAATRRAASAADAPVLFGQASVKSTFAHGPHAGRTIGEVAEGLRAGAISPNTLPIDYVIRNGQAVALNNRSLLALKRAGMEPTVTRNLTGNEAAEALLNSHLQGGAPSMEIRVRGGPTEASLIE